MDAVHLVVADLGHPLDWHMLLADGSVVDRWIAVSPVLLASVKQEDDLESPVERVYFELALHLVSL